MPPNYSLVAQQLVLALRGRRSQARLSTLLGYRSNALYTWESGTAFPHAARLFELALTVGVDLSAGLARYYREVPDTLRDVSLSTPEGVVQLLTELRGRTRIVALAQAMGLSRYTLSRWFSGKTQPNVPELLCFVDHSSLRLLDFLSVLVDPEKLPSVARAWRALQHARALGYDKPLTQAVLRALETTRYGKIPCSKTIEALTGLGPAEVSEALALLLESDQVTQHQGRYSPREIQVVDFRRDTLAAQQLKAFWAQLAADRVRQGAPGLSAYNVFAVSRSDLTALEQLQRSYLAEMRTIIARSEPSEVVALASFQLLSLDEISG